MKRRLQTVLSHAGVASRRRAAELIEKGHVKVDGRRITEKGYRLDPARCEVLVDGRPISKEKKYYFLLNKPKGFISTARDTHSRRKVTDIFDKVNARLYPVGRLDKDTTGLILITNDGDLAHRMAHPSFEVEKEYVASVEGDVKISDIKKIEKGIELDGKLTAPCRIMLRRKGKKRTVYRVKLREGKKRHIKRMFEAIGGRVVELKRVKYAGLAIGDLKEGEYRALSGREVKELKNKVK